MEWRDEDGRTEALELLPPATEAEIRALQSGLPCPLPTEIRSALEVSKGLANGPLESFNLLGLNGFGLEKLFPSPHSIAHDGIGNYWLVDLHPGSTAWSPVFYACHDPPVIVYQAATIEEFLRDAIRPQLAGPRSTVDVVHEEATARIWRHNPGLVRQAVAAESSDPELRAFAASLTPDCEIADLRHATTGQGFSWGRYGPATMHRRHGSAHIWAIARPSTKARMRAWWFGG